MKLKIDALIKDSGLKKLKIAKDLGVTDDTLTNWIKGRTYPRLDQAVGLAKILGCKVDDLYEE